jgi:hypothetical protein
MRGVFRTGACADSTGSTLPSIPRSLDVLLLPHVTGGPPQARPVDRFRFVECGGVPIVIANAWLTGFDIDGAPFRLHLYQRQCGTASRLALLFIEKRPESAAADQIQGLAVAEPAGEFPHRHAPGP